MLYHWQKFTILLGEFAFLVIIVKAEIRKDYFNGGCGVVRRLNDKISYQVVTSRYSPISERCILAFKYVGRWENTISVCANVVKFRLKCNRDRRLVLVLMKEDGSNRKEFDCKTGKPTEAYCGEFVYMYLRNASPITGSYFDDNTYLLINVESRTGTVKGEINYVEIIVPFACGILVLLTIIAVVWKIRAERRKMRLRSPNIINLSQQIAGVSQSNSLGRNSQVRYSAVPNQYVDLVTSPRQQSQSHIPNHETDINTLQTVNQRPPQFNTTEMNHGNHGAVIQNSSDSLMSSGNQVEEGHGNL